MGLPLYLAMTAAEMSGCRSLPKRTAWMACRFSAAGDGISNCPHTLPEGALLILDDSQPIQGHDPALVARRLQQVLEETQAVAVLLDFQRPGHRESAQMVRHLAGALPCPVAVSACYGRETDGPVLLPPPPLNRPLEQHLAPWQGRQLWLEAALESACFTVTAEGTQVLPCPMPELAEAPLTDEALHCRYEVRTEKDRASFALWRDRACLDRLLEQAQAQGVHQAIALYQQLSP